jgi:hypothetical protein
MSTRFVTLAVLVLFVCSADAMMTRSQLAAQNIPLVQLGAKNMAFAQATNLFEPLAPQVVQSPHLFANSPHQFAAPPPLSLHRSNSYDSFGRGAQYLPQSPQASPSRPTFKRWDSLSDYLTETPPPVQPPTLRRWNSLFGPDPNAPQPPPALSPFSFSGSPMASQPMQASSPSSWQLPNMFQGASPAASPFAQYMPASSPFAQYMPASSPFAQMPLVQPMGSY